MECCYKRTPGCACPTSDFCWSDVFQWDKLVTWFNVFQTTITVQNIGKGFYRGGLKRHDRDTIARIYVIIQKGNEISFPVISRMLTQLKEVRSTWRTKIVYVERGRFWTSWSLTDFIFFENYFLLSYNTLSTKSMFVYTTAKITLRLMVLKEQK